MQSQELYCRAHVQVLMVIFDILASHHRMLLWHESSVENLLKETADLQRARQQAEAAESSSHGEQNGLEYAQEESNETAGHAERPTVSSNDAETAAAEGLQSANLPLDRR